jgi:hypothetical protein
MLARAIDGYRAPIASWFPECFCVRAPARPTRCDLDSGIAALERSRTAVRSSAPALNAGVALYEDAIRISVDRGDLERAFNTQSARARSLTTRVSSVRTAARLAGSNAAVLEVVVLPDEVCPSAYDTMPQWRGGHSGVRRQRLRFRIRARLAGRTRISKRRRCLRTP